MEKNKTKDFSLNGRRFGANRFTNPGEKPKNFKETIKRLWITFGKERKNFIIVFILVLVNSAVGLIVPVLLGKAIDTMKVQKGNLNFDTLKIIIFALVCAYLIDVTMNFIQNFSMAGISQRIVKNMRKVLYEKLQNLPISYFDTNPHGDTMSRLTNDVDNVSVTISSSTIQLMSSVITIVGSLLMMLKLSFVLTLASLITVPLVFLLTKTIAKRTKVYFKNQQQVLGILNSQIEESISGIEVVKGFNREEKIIDEFEDMNIKYRNVGFKAQVWAGFLMPMMNAIKNLGFAAVACVGGYLASNDIITVGIITAFLTYSEQFTRPLNEIANIFNTLQSAVAGAERVFELLDEKEEVSDRQNSIEIKNIKGDVEFKNVTFGYNKNTIILKDISFKAKQGMAIALVGATGSGKTTIVNLLTRFYEINEGSITIDDVDIRDYTRDSLRSAFSIVLQDTYFFEGSIKDNIKYGKLDATDEEIENAAKMANAHTFINRLHNGYETLLLEGASNLSAGQKQLLAIARAILANTSILILDEATSNVDTRTEAKIQEAMLKLMEGRTSFIIAHRLSTIREADLIMVIEDGNIIEKGNHNELMNLGGKYYSLNTY
jgi:ATP-binding cassette subfamily B protein